MNSNERPLTPRTALAVALVGAIALSACSKADENQAAAPTATAGAAATAPAAGSGTSPFASPPPTPSGPPPPPTADASSWTPDALDELLAPVALYPEPVLAQVLTASTNPQEVLDAGNWLIDNEALTGEALTKAAAEKGFSPPVQALLLFPTTVDMMCRELDWTRQVGEAFTADQAAVLASVQRLRAQAKEVGNLKSSPQMAVDETTENGKTVIEIKPADPQVIYVPQYNPQTVYTTPPAAAPATTTTTTTESNSSGLTTGEAVMGGLLAFGAGVLVANAFDDDDDDYWGYPNYGYGGVYYGGAPYRHNTFVYAPRYPGYRPAGGYRPPGNYGNNYRNTNVNVNVNNNYYNRFDKNQNRVSSYKANSPVTGSRAAGSGGYKGADRPRTTATNTAARDRSGAGSGAYKGGGSSAYKGAAQNRQGTSASRREAAHAQRPTSSPDRGYPKASGSRPDSVASSNRGSGGAFAGAGANQGGRDRAASQRGRSSMQSAPRPSSHAGGGGRSGGGRGGGGRGGR